MARRDFALVQPDSDIAFTFQEGGELADKGLGAARMAQKDGNHGEEGCSQKPRRMIDDITTSERAPPGASGWSIRQVGTNVRLSEFCFGVPLAGPAEWPGRESARGGSSAPIFRKSHRDTGKRR
jgi:hypothetical protein